MAEKIFDSTEPLQVTSTEVVRIREAVVSFGKILKNGIEFIGPCLRLLDDEESEVEEEKKE